MKRGQRSGKTHAREDLAEHFAIKPKATEPAGERLRNDALDRPRPLLSPSDPRWQMEPPYGWVKFDPLTHRGNEWRCWYCAESCGDGTNLLYSHHLGMLAHSECYAGGDTIAPKRATVDST